MFGKKKIVYQGFDMQEFNKIRELLRGAGIWHDWKVDDRQTHFLAPGKGTVRGSFGSAGVNLDITKEYKILVKEKNKQRVAELEKTHRENLSKLTDHQEIKDENHR